ncbi:MAG: hypothetical protein OEN49_04305, partial [Gammaproteobacteria bacterium]|nr:hypothetical protein [Gammaproteobacteria bacterium]
MGGINRLRTGKELNSPYGGILINFLVPPSRANELKSFSKDLISIDLSPRQLTDLEMLATGVYSPL